MFIELALVWQGGTIVFPSGWSAHRACLVLPWPCVHAGQAPLGGGGTLGAASSVEWQTDLVLANASLCPFPAVGDVAQLAAGTPGGSRGLADVKVGGWVHGGAVVSEGL